MVARTETIRRLETRFWQSMVDKDPETAMEMIAAECLIAGPSGTMRIDPEAYGKMTREGQWTLKDFEFDDLEVVFPTDDVAVVAYKVHQIGDMKGKKMDLRCADTSTWVKQDGDWKCSAHTETVLEDRAKAN
jgi:hypothetical protein